MSASVPNNPDRASLTGNFFEAGAGKSTASILRVAEGTVVITNAHDNQTIVRAKRNEVSISDRIGTIPRRLTLPDNSVFVTSDNNGVDRLVGTSMSDASVNWLEKFHPRMIIIAVVAIGLVLAMYRYALPVAINVAVAATPNAVIKAISKASFTGLEDRLFKPTKVDKERQEKLAAAFQDLISHSDGRVKSLEPHLRFHASPIGPNAFALPDGTIVVTDALLKLVDDDTVIGVLGHELGHVRHQHGLRLIYRSVGFFVMIQLIAGDVGGIFEDALVQGAGILTLSYSRNFERQADDYSIILMKRAGRDPLALTNFFEKIAQKLENKNSIIPGWLSTHPSSAERVKRIQEQAGKK
ncbi:MAG: M48 family metallopeptidase [Hyphomicrobiales bacterium]